MTRWLINDIPKSAPIRLFCFHYAGGGASCFSGWAKLLGDDIAVCSVQLPGRESRFHEPRITSFDELIDKLYEQLTPYLEQPYAFYGHSLGGLIAYALAHKRYAAKQTLPLSLFVGAHRAPHIPYSFPSCKTMKSSELTALLGLFEGIPESILQNEELMSVLLPLIRDDLLLCESYQHHWLKPLPCPIYAFGGDSDRIVSKFEILSWRQHTTIKFKSNFYPTGHFFIKNHKTQLVNMIKLAIQAELSLSQPLLSGVGGG